MRHVLIFALLLSFVSACEAADSTEESAAGTPDVTTNPGPSPDGSSATDVSNTLDAAVDSAATADTAAGDTTGPSDDTAQPAPDVAPAGCTSDADCAPGEICEVNSGVCLSDTGCDDQCELGDVGCIDDVAWACVNGLSGCTELSETDCTLQNQTCFAGLCIAGNTEPDCKTDLDCQPGEVCLDGEEPFDLRVQDRDRGVVRIDLVLHRGRGHD